MASSISTTPPSRVAAALLRGRPRPLCLPPSFPRSWPRRLSITARLYSSKSSSSGGTNGSLEDHSSSSSFSSSSSSSTGEGKEFKHHLPPPQRSSKAVPVFVTLPIDVVTLNGLITRSKAMRISLRALKAAGVEGVVVELWWGIVERDGPGVYDWLPYLYLVNLARKHSLKVRAIMAFHQCGAATGSQFWVPLPGWVLREMDKEPNLAYIDRFGRTNREYISLGCDLLPVLCGRSPVQAYSDFMRSFRDTFRDYLGVTVTEIQVGMGPAGELRYPSFPTEKLTGLRKEPELGEFQCYDKYMQASLNACARRVGYGDWGNGGPFGTNDPMQNDPMLNPEQTSFFKTDGTWNAAYGRFFLQWYSGMLLSHGERLCEVTSAIFRGAGVNISAKVAGIYWHYLTCSHPSELTAGYYNTINRDGYIPIAQMFARYRVALCCSCFDMTDAEIKSESKISPESFLQRLIFAARMCNLPLNGENSVIRHDSRSLNQVIESSRLYWSGASEPSLSFNFVRMNEDLFEPSNWNHFTRFVRRMSNARTFQANLAYRGSKSCFSTSAAEEVGRFFVCH